MARYGEGHPGVLAVFSLDGDAALGRSFFLKDLPDIDRIAAGRTPPELEPGLVAHLGEPYARLRAAHLTPPARPAAPAPAAPAAGQAGPSQIELLAQAVIRGDIQADPDQRKMLEDALFADIERHLDDAAAAEPPRPASQAPEPAAPTGQAAGEPFTELDRIQAQQRGRAARSEATRAALAAFDAIALPDLPAEARGMLERAQAERWRQAAQSEPPPPDDRRAALIRLVGGPQGASGREIAAALGEPVTTVSRWLNRLAADGLIVRGKGRGRGARWHLNPAHGQ